MCVSYPYTHAHTAPHICDVKEVVRQYVQCMDAWNVTMESRATKQTNVNMEYIWFSFKCERKKNKRRVWIARYNMCISIAYKTMAWSTVLIFFSLILSVQRNMTQIQVDNRTHAHLNNIRRAQTKIEGGNCIQRTQRQNETVSENLQIKINKDSP